MPKNRPLCRQIGNHTKENMKDALLEIASNTTKKDTSCSKENNIHFQRYIVTQPKQKHLQVSKMCNFCHIMTLIKFFTEEQEQALTEYYNNYALMFYGLTTKD